MSREPLPDYSATIRAEIEREVRNLTPAYGASQVFLGYMVNTHHGRALYQEGDKIDGMPVTIDTRDRRTIRVGVRSVTW
jgi:hypothetical protein